MPSPTGQPSGPRTTPSSENPNGSGERLFTFTSWRRRTMDKKATKFVRPVPFSTRSDFGNVRVVRYIFRTRTNWPSKISNRTIHPSDRTDDSAVHFLSRYIVIYDHRDCYIYIYTVRLQEIVIDPLYQSKRISSLNYATTSTRNKTVRYGHTRSFRTFPLSSNSLLSYGLPAGRYCFGRVTVRIRRGRIILLFGKQ